jgi:uncharacterized protein
VPDLEIAVTPRASADRVGPFVDGILKVRVTRPPADGDANRVVLRLVARALDVAPTRISIVAGVRGRRKRLRIEGLDAPELDRRLNALRPPD